MKELNRFSLEEKIMDCWGVCDDINTVYTQFDLSELTQDQIQNALLGISTLYQMKFEQLFSVFEQLIVERKL